MKSMSFFINKENIKSEESPFISTHYEYVVKIHIPILPAFSVEYFSLNLGGTTGMASGNDTIDGTTLIMESEAKLTEDMIAKGAVVTIHYHGIRDYSLLFPWIEKIELRERLGAFYEESEKILQQGAWLSFSLMCGAIFEGMLYAKLDYPTYRNTFYDMISDAFEQNIIDERQRNIIHEVRTSRNLVHGNKYQTAYVTRRSTMDIRITLDSLIKEFSN
ncbi:DUF4145 domain-containing protein [Metabacillus fastidiosus]|uniref:DUF4145 domain-containing protein n=1 Tax=Metabacillus fastidiosus TaxID=1458 RepID=UPI002E1AD769|nr:DUF4145 domain-containing protein [Metabacillus fastidiosus]